MVENEAADLLQAYTQSGRVHAELGAGVLRPAPGESDGVEASGSRPFRVPVHRAQTPEVPTVAARKAGWRLVHPERGIAKEKRPLPAPAAAARSPPQ